MRHGRRGVHSIDEMQEKSRLGQAFLDRAGIVAATMHVKVRQMQAMQAGSRPSAATGDADNGRILPGGMAVQVWQQAVYPLANS